MEVDDGPSIEHVGFYPLSTMLDRKIRQCTPNLQLLKVSPSHSSYFQKMSKNFSMQIFPKYVFHIFPLSYDMLMIY